MPKSQHKSEYRDKIKDIKADKCHDVILEYKKGMEKAIKRINMLIKLLVNYEVKLRNKNFDAAQKIRKEIFICMGRMKAKRLYSVNELSIILNNHNNVLKLIKDLRKMKKAIFFVTKKFKIKKLIAIYGVVSEIISSKALVYSEEEKARDRMREKYNIKINRDDMMRSYKAMRKFTEMIRTLFKTRISPQSFYGMRTIKNPAGTVVRVIIDMPLDVFAKAEVAVKIAYDRAGDIEKAAEEMLREILRSGRKGNSNQIHGELGRDSKKESPEGHYFGK
jgi:hypothetical protein